ncbi:Phosphoribosylaminoimidazolesuccinocarboxamide synthase (plasmid) [Streptomyces alboflavus]|uniref:phosphoribosylaminoimidazolesuccinocarboxamide synthase n=1 Tax=Streptomyces alboflavus TaxID=67267 RepID=A0A291W3X1_9ACTN|nr:phosphoribosylaminoimidazolesuccinocarboxamide synthase [Streptomyces alboflavus]ATM24607.1 Phosphoribosylaminoimidazolesuccinocarboxamide synthase [Streptomyces alboflavus]
MPDAIPGKGEAVCRMAAFNFQLLQAAGIRTHFRRFIAPRRIEFDLARVPDTGPQVTDGANRLLPVQVLFRNELPPGSSVHRRLASGTLTPAHVGLDGIPQPGATLPRPLLEYATMREDTNRFLDPGQAQRLAALSDEQFRQLNSLTLQVNEVLTGHARSLGLSHCDGKVEFVLSGDGDLVVADSPGTPDESRLMFNGVHCGKQVLRDWYVAQGLDVPVSDLIAQGVPRDRWPQPASLPPAFLPVMSDLYRSLSQRWTGECRWGAPDLPSATTAVGRLFSQ